jgi:hypothetical protein
MRAIAMSFLAARSASAELDGEGRRSAVRTTRAPTVSYQSTGAISNPGFWTQVSRYLVSHPQGGVLPQWVDAKAVIMDIEAGPKFDMVDPEMSDTDSVTQASAGLEGP